MRESRTSGSVGAGGGQPPSATRQNAFAAMRLSLPQVVVRLRRGVRAAVRCSAASGRDTPQ